MSYYVGNIDPDISDNDIYQYLTDSGVKCTYIDMFYGRYGSAAKINIPENCLLRTKYDTYRENNYNDDYNKYNYENEKKSQSQSVYNDYDVWNENIDCLDDIINH